jgi:hypothetical protein
MRAAHERMQRAGWQSPAVAPVSGYAVIGNGAAGSASPGADRIATAVDELARARRVQDLNTAVMLPDPRGPNPAGAGRAGPGVPGLLRPAAAACFLDSATGAGLGCLAGRAIPAR